MPSIIIKTAAALMISASLIACSGGSNSPEDVSAQISKAKTPEAAKAIALKEIKDMSPIEMMEYAAVNSNKLADVMAGVKDEDSARAAAEELRTLGPRLSAMGERLKNLDESDLSISIKTMNVMKDFGKAQMRVAAETARIAQDHPELRSVFEDEFEDLELDFK